MLHWYSLDLKSTHPKVHVLEACFPGGLLGRQWNLSKIGSNWWSLHYWGTSCLGRETSDLSSFSLLLRLCGGQFLSSMSSPLPMTMWCTGISQPDSQHTLCTTVAICFRNRMLLNIGLIPRISSYVYANEPKSRMIWNLKCYGPQNFFVLY